MFFPFRKTKKSSHLKGAAKVLLVVDRPNWAYHAIAKALTKHIEDPKLDFDITYPKGAEKGIREGDLIVEVAQEEVATPQDVLAKVKKVMKSKRKSVLLLLERGGDLRFVAVRLGEG